MCGWRCDQLFGFPQTGRDRRTFLYQRRCGCASRYVWFGNWLTRFYLTVGYVLVTSHTVVITFKGLSIREISKKIYFHDSWSRVRSSLLTLADSLTCVFLASSRSISSVLVMIPLIMSSSLDNFKNSKTDSRNPSRKVGFTYSMKKKIVFRNGNIEERSPHRIHIP